MVESKRAVMAALVGNGALALLKGVAAAATGSAAMLAETFHSLADTGNQVLLFLGMRLSTRPPDRTHPFGYGKDIYFWSFVVAIMLFTLGGAFSIWEGVRKLLHASGGHVALVWAYAVLAGAFAFEATSLAVAVHALGQAMAERSLGEYWRDNRDTTILTVVLEDSAALLSLGIAASGLWLSHHTGSGVWDALASGAIGLILIVVAILIAVENHSLLIGERAPEGVERLVRALVTEDPEVVHLGDLRTMHIGPDDILIALGVQFRHGPGAPPVEVSIERLQGTIENALGGSTNARLIVIEPMMPGAAAGALPASNGASRAPRSH